MSDSAENNQKEVHYKMYNALINDLQTLLDYLCRKEKKIVVHVTCKQIDYKKGIVTITVDEIKKHDFITKALE